MHKLYDLTKLKKFAEEAFIVSEELLSIKDEFNTAQVKFRNVLTPIFWRSFNRLRTILSLISQEQSADAVMGLARCSLEELISIYFMELKGKDKMAQRFLDYTYVERKLENDKLISWGFKSENSKETAVINKDYELVKKDFLYKNGIAKSWAKCQVEQMLGELLKENFIKPEDNEFIIEAYILGNRKNTFIFF